MADKGCRVPQAKWDSSRYLGATEAEVDVWRLLGTEGYSAQEIADRLFLSVKTVNWHIDHLMKKLKMSNRTKLALLWVKGGFE